MKETDSQTQIGHTFEEFHYSELFNKFVKDFSNAKLLNKTIKFYQVYSWFSFYRIEKQDARRIIREWVQRGFCQVVTYSGIKVGDEDVGK